jgi:hypothetical protein
MYLLIHIHELPEQFHHPNSMDRLYNLGIDYMTNSLDAIVDGVEVRIFNFDSVGIKLDNRFNHYEISKGQAGIMINIIKN